ncbi:PREDICTED: UDP-glycosyltransferase TURAN isoform X1 [Lupinus angustifolius]|uniref:UDP-glycosyltransferase TURAN isoform X1 n=2 Tax=Lupinus angustifolius TaxID=3871 RepID=UPI00092F97BC|nr:PREDICTED: UDP-glycosyltransferase TURAN isoform X1 [Lupinus angustifolius]XP_019433858.1 PREDICTED: UDP-glycosyltransferase TURAN isoform X1 [Lupinus angustifolius]
MAGKMEEKKGGRKGRACVVVLGDIGRSPRMQYHALSLANQASLEVDIVAYGGSEPHAALLANPSIHIHIMQQWPTSRQSLPKILQPIMLLLKPLVQIFMLLYFLCVKITSPDVFIVQNPPSVPTLVAVKWASWLRNSSFVIDWHNFGYTLLALSLGRNSHFVSLYKWFEKHYGKMADASLCVTRAMQHELAQNWGINATVLYDQPPQFFHPASLEERHKLFCRLNEDFCKPLGVRDCASDGTSLMGSHFQNETLFTAEAGSDIYVKPNRPALVVSSTSWTPDEDFSILLEAAVMYDRRVAAILGEDDSLDEEVIWKEISDGKQCLYPRLLFVITGKGPEKEMYEAKIKRLKLKRVAFRTMWLSAEDYPLLLGSADLGVCLHTSSSGLDLPMKVVDMFGCGLPVCAVSYSCIKELVSVDKNGILFSSSSELADELLMLFKGFPDECDALKVLKNGALETGSSARWATEWEEHAKPLITKAVSRF